ncbi:hypothetical protein FACS189475_07290 [Betaproteobacteria bacterium]|nr:hypothetical protein FACS189475_07290 [Betaproteobacteria bacterium]
MPLIETLSLARPYPEALAYVIRLERDEESRFHVFAGLEGAERDRCPEGRDEPSARHLYERLAHSRLKEGFQPAAESTVEPRAFVLPEPGEKLLRFQQALLKRLHPDVWRALAPVKRSRLVWQLGEHRVTQAVPSLLPLLGSGNAMLDYCLCWALGRSGRCGNDSQALPALDALRQQGHSDSVKRMATLAWLELSDEAARQAHAGTLIDDWPAWLRKAWASGDSAQIESAFANKGKWQPLRREDWLEQLDQLAQAPTHRLAARALLMRLIAELPLEYGTYRTIRRLYKAAEFRGDADLYGLLHERFETTMHTMQNRPSHVRVGKRYLPFAEALKDRPESVKVAYTQRTRDYLRRRTWRNLRRLARVENHEFIPLALGVLAAFRDEHADEARTDPNASWDSRQRKMVEHPLHYSPYSCWMAYHHLLHAHTERLTRVGARWVCRDPWNADLDGVDTVNGPREEAFPDLWDQHPQALLWLLQRAQCAGVTRFAARALRANLVFCASLQSGQLTALLQSPIPAVVEFAFHCIQERLEQTWDIAQESQWLLTLVSTPLEKARRFALERISADPARYAADTELIAAMLCAPDDGIRKIARLLCEAAKNRLDTPKAILAHLLNWLEDCEAWSGPLPEITDNLLWVLQHSLQSDAAQAPYERLLALLNHPASPLVRLAANWLTLHRDTARKLPPETLRALLESDNPEICGAGISLFSTLPENVQIAQPQLFIAFCLSIHAEVRHAVIPVLERLAQTRPHVFDSFAKQISAALVDALFRSETAAGMHDDLLSILQGSLQQAARATDSATHLRLCTARSKGAQRFGAYLLSERRAEDFNVADWAALARTSTQITRQWACDCYRDHPAAVESDMEAALRIFDSPWDDAQTFAQAFFREHGRWTPALLISLCDHGKLPVQNFGRELIARHADLQDVVNYLLKLSQHPSTAIQWMVSDWLEAGVGENIQRLQQLQPYFLTVLSQVNRARKAKNRVLDFLRRQALKSEAAAATVIEIFARQVVSVAITDKAQYLQGLQEIHAHFPQLPSPLVVQALPRHSVGRP